MRKSCEGPQGFAHAWRCTGGQQGFGRYGVNLDGQWGATAARMAAGIWWWQFGLASCSRFVFPLRARVAADVLRLWVGLSLGLPRRPAVLFWWQSSDPPVMHAFGIIRNSEGPQALGAVVRSDVHGGREAGFAHAWRYDWPAVSGVTASTWRVSGSSLRHARRPILMVFVWPGEFQSFRH